jgi:hypothetical protein
MRLQTIIIAALMTGGCASHQGQSSLFGESKPNRGIPVVDKSTHISSPVVMRGAEVISKPAYREAEKHDQLAQAEVFVPAPPIASTTFTVNEQPGQLSQAELTAPAPAPVKADTPARMQAPDAAEFKPLVVSQPPTVVKTPVAAKPKISAAEKAEIDRLTLKYAESDVNAAYKLAKLLYKVQRNEEADVVVDYAARNNNVPAMLLYSERLLSQGDLMNSNQWLELAADAGSKEAKAKLGEGSHVN